jgi:hypothetical protein
MNAFHLIPSSNEHHFWRSADAGDSSSLAIAPPFLRERRGCGGCVGSSYILLNVATISKQYTFHHPHPPHSGDDDDTGDGGGASVTAPAVAAFSISIIIAEIATRCPRRHPGFSGLVFIFNGVVPLTISTILITKRSFPYDYLSRRTDCKVHR